MDTFEKEKDISWTGFAEQCIRGAYGETGAESIINKQVSVDGSTRTITKAGQLGRLMAKGNIQKVTRKEVFAFMDELRRQSA